MGTLEQKEKNIKNKDEFSLYRYVKKNWKNILIFILLALLVIVYLLKNNELINQKKSLTEKYNDLYDASVDFSKIQSNYYLELVANTFSLAIVSEINRNNYDNVNLYLSSLIKKDNKIIEIVVSNEKDIIISSTNKKHENTSLREYLSFNYANLKHVVIIPDKELKYRLIITPLFALNEQKGVLIIKYEPEYFSYKEK